MRTKTNETKLMDKNSGTMNIYKPSYSTMKQVRENSKNVNWGLNKYVK